MTSEPPSGKSMALSSSCLAALTTLRRSVGSSMICCLRSGKMPGATMQIGDENG